MGQIVALLACALAVGWRVPTGNPRIDQWHGMLLAAGIVALMLQRPVAWRWRLIALWAIPVTLLKPDAFGIAWLWLATWLLVCLAIGQLSAAEIRRAVLWVGWLQVPLVLLEVVHHPLYETIGGGFAGSFGRRYLLAAWWGLCSLWSEGPMAWGWAVASLATTSWIGAVPAIVRLLWRRRWLIVPAVGVALVALRQSIAIRWQVWQGVHWWPPLGFAPLPSGFLGDGEIDRLLQWRDYHSAVLESWARFGPWAVVLGGAVGWALLRRDKWIALWIGLLACCQSVEAYPIAAWIMALAVQGGIDGSRALPQAPVAS